MAGIENKPTNLKATRDAYGDALVELGKARKDVVVLDADLSGSTKTNLFSKEFPERFFNVGVAEQNLVGHAAGFAISGFVPFASSFAMFLAGRAWEVVRNSIGYPGLNVKLVASHGGISVGEDGASHQCIEDFSLMRTIPCMTVICPSDYNEAKQVIHAIASYNGPVYVRVGRPAIPVIERESYSFQIGKAEVRSDGDDVCIIANGLTVSPADLAAKMLASEKSPIHAAVLNMATIKPLDKETILAYAKKCKAIVTCEEHSVVGGLGSAVSEFLSEECPVPVIKLGVKDVFGKSGKWDELLDVFEINADGIIKHVKKAIAMKLQSNKM
jgi:transketolase